MMLRLSIFVVVAVAAIGKAESEAELAYSPEELQGRNHAPKVSLFGITCKNTS